MTSEWNPYEDGQPAKGWIEDVWTPEDKFIWRMGVEGVGLGGVILVGSFDGELKLGLLFVARRENRGTSAGATEHTDDEGV